MVIRKIYHAVVSEKVRNRIAEIIYNADVKRRLIKFYFRLLYDYICGKLKKYKKEILYIMKHGVMMFPYEFTTKYRKFSCQIVFDKDEEKFYVLHRGGKEAVFP